MFIDMDDYNNSNSNSNNDPSEGDSPGKKKLTIFINNMFTKLISNR
jgi:hypothetical protein